MLLQKMVTSDARQDAVVHVCQVYAVSQRRACAVLCVDRLSVRYRRKRPDDAHICEAMKQVAPNGGASVSHIGHTGKQAP